ncbi:MAG: 16S rRNA (adenine(1518)-N(6)/adenine(1519)-N(6))-dimethyltransferase RsmA [Eubacteriales bacterium]|nr:16S rRNA (adenine(1518)-N(6)/adenine(1519)-N(6))-dimethyltransferase RsmA [Eubacteriales bacterium]
MDVTRPSEITDLLQRYGLKPRKSWGQNFLANKGVVAKLMAAAQLTGAETVLEIGPGLGVMTEPLLDSSSQVVAVEIDPLLCQFLARRFSQRDNFQLVQGDALAQDFSLLIPGPYIVVANLPYYITSPLLAKLVEEPQPPERAVTLVQWEVARRLTALPGTADYGALSILIQYHCEAELLFKIGPGNFYPPPQVDSAAVRLQWRPSSFQPRNEKFMFRLVKIAFSQRRKMLKGLLAAALGLSKDQAGKALAQIGLSEEIRGEKLSIKDFAALADILEGQI